PRGGLGFGADSNARASGENRIRFLSIRENRSMTAIPLEQVRAFRLQSHHLDRPLPLDLLTAAVGACGVQNSPPGTWETAMWNRVEGITLRQLEHALYEEK